MVVLMTLALGVNPQDYDAVIAEAHSTQDVQRRLSLWEHAWTLSHGNGEATHGLYNALIAADMPDDARTLYINIEPSIREQWLDVPQPSQPSFQVWSRAQVTGLLADSALSGTATSWTAGVRHTGGTWVSARVAHAGDKNGSQDQLSAALGWSNATRGGELIVGLVRPSDDNARPLLAARGWAADRSCSATASAWTHDGAHGARVDGWFAATPQLSIGLGTQYTVGSTLKGLAVIPQFNWTYDDWLVTGALGLGKQVQPFRADTQVLYNLDAPVDGSVSTSFTRQVTRHLAFGAHLDALHTDVGWAVQPGVHLTLTSGGSR